MKLNYDNFHNKILLIIIYYLKSRFGDLNIEKYKFLTNIGIAESWML